MTETEFQTRIAELYGLSFREDYESGLYDS
jgi:hypothetical protein